MYKTVETTAVRRSLQNHYRNIVESRRKQQSDRVFAAREELRSTLVKLFSGQRHRKSKNFCPLAFDELVSIIFYE